MSVVFFSACPGKAAGGPEAGREDVPGVRAAVECELPDVREDVPDWAGLPALPLVRWREEDDTLEPERPGRPPRCAQPGSETANSPRADIKQINFFIASQSISKRPGKVQKK
jgi:hypothetical protein